MSQSKLKKGIFYIFIANIINLIISLFTGFVLPKYLSIETYANIKLFQLYVTYIGIVSLGFADGMYLRHGGKNLENLNKKEVLVEFKTYKIFQIIVSIIAIIISACLKNEILLFCSIIIFPVNVAGYLRNLYQATGLFKRYSRFTNINTLLIFIINVILLFIIKTDSAFIYIVSYCIVYFLYWIFIEVSTIKLFGKRQEKIKSNISYLKDDIKSGFFILIGNFCNVIFTSIDRLFVQHLLGLVKFAFYSFAVSVENLMNVFVTPISTVMYNYFCNHNEAKDVIYVKKYLILFASAVIIVIFPAKFVVNFWLVKYVNSLGVLFLLFASQYISIMVRCVHVNLYKSEKKQSKYFKIMLFVVILSIVLNVIAYFISKSINAIAIATLITNIIWFIIGEIEFKKYILKIKDYTYIFAILVFFLMCGFISNAIVGCIVYFGITLLLAIILEKDILFKFMNEMVLILKNKFVRKNLEER